MSGELQQSPDSPINQVHSIINGNVVPVLRTDPQAYVVNDGTYDRVMMGGLGDGTYGLKVSKSGFDVKTTGNANIVMSSAYNAFKIVATGTVTVVDPGTAGGAITDGVVTHNLGATPSSISFVNYPGVSAGLYLNAGLEFDQITATTSHITLRTYVLHDVNTITFRVVSNSSGFGGNFKFRYYLLQETAAQ
jgi:hypothetical protein